MRALGRLAGSLLTVKGRKRARPWAIRSALMVYLFSAHIMAGQVMDLVVALVLLAIWWAKVTEGQDSGL